MAGAWPISCICKSLHSLTTPMYGGNQPPLGVSLPCSKTKATLAPLPMSSWWCEITDQCFTKKMFGSQSWTRRLREIPVGHLAEDPQNIYQIHKSRPLVGNQWTPQASRGQPLPPGKSPAGQFFSHPLPPHSPRWPSAAAKKNAKWAPLGLSPPNAPAPLGELLRPRASPCVSCSGPRCRKSRPNALRGPWGNMCPLCW